MANSGTLYIFMHGLSLVKEWPDHLEVVLPRVPDHAIKAGNWLEETPIAPKSRLELAGVNAGGASIPKPGFTIDLTAFTLTHRKRAATLILPKPDSIIGLLRVVAPNAVTQTGTGAVVATQVATMQIFSYSYGDENLVALNGHYWEPRPVGGAISLHVISTSEGPIGDRHEKETEDVLRECISGYPGLIFTKAPPPVWAGAEPQFLGGTRTISKLLPQTVVTVQSGVESFAFSLAELEDIGARSVRVARLGRLKQGGRPIQSLWQLPDPLGEDASNCQMGHVA